MSIDIPSEASRAPLSADAFTRLFQAIRGLRNGRAVIAMLACTFVGVIVASLLLATSGALGAFAALLALIAWMVAIGTGFNAAGLLQMDDARGISPRSVVDALVQGLMCIPKLIVLALAFIAVELVVLVVIALLLVICKIPYLGTALFVVVFPVSVVLAGTTLAALFLCATLSLPAIWQGAGITRALAQTAAILRSRLVETVLLLVFVGFLSFAVAMIVFGVLSMGLVPTLGLSMAIVGFGGFGPEAMMTMSSGGGHAMAGVIGGALLWAVAASLLAQVYLLGLSMVYLRVTEGLDLTAAEAALRATVDDARRRAAQLGEKAREATQPSPAAAPVAPAAPAAPAAPRPVAAPMTDLDPTTRGPDIDLAHRRARARARAVGRARVDSDAPAVVVRRDAAVDGTTGQRTVARSGAAAAGDDLPAMPLGRRRRRPVLRRLRLPAQVAARRALN